MDNSKENQYSQIDFGYECDLHFFGPEETAAVIKEFIKQAVDRGLQEIRLVHGKGTSVKKREAYALLSQHPDVRFYGNDGSNWGATIILIKKKQS
jgi:DNA-nicking Smr family endonuclease